MAGLNQPVYAVYLNEYTGIKRSANTKNNNFSIHKLFTNCLLYCKILYEILNLQGLDLESIQYKMQCNRSNKWVYMWRGRTKSCGVLSCSFNDEWIIPQLQGWRTSLSDCPSYKADAFHVTRDDKASVVFCHMWLCWWGKLTCLSTSSLTPH